MRDAVCQLNGAVGVLGYGVDGECVADFLLRRNDIRKIVIFDDNKKKQQMQINDRGMHSTVFNKPNVVFASDGMDIDGVDLFFRSPGFPLTHKLVKEAKSKKIPITSSTAHFLANYSGVSVGVTGSNGKTTCVALITEMLKAQFGAENVKKGGNDGVPRLNLLEEETLKAGGKNQFVVLEMSSFQLIDCPFSPDVAVILNITPNHLDWHKNMEEYSEAKRRIVMNQKKDGIAILNPDDGIVRSFAEGLVSEVKWFTDLPKCEVRFISHPDTVRAAVTAARALGVSEDNIKKTLEGFHGVPHRLEFVREIGGARYYNDSSCTTPESAAAACNAFSVGSVVLLLGGRDKGMDFSKMYEIIKERDVRVVPYGEMGETFKKHLSHNCLAPVVRSSLTDAVNAASRIANYGDNVVLSPACASFDMFKNAKDRGDKFTEIVEGL